MDLAARKVLSWTQLAGRQFMSSRAEGEAAGRLAMKDARMKEARLA